MYEFDKEKAIAEFNYRFFPAYDEEWMDFIVSSRSGERLWDGLDIIEGGIANDRVIDTIRLYMFGEMEKSTALRRLSEHQPNHQICILNQEVADKYPKSVFSVLDLRKEKDPLLPDETANPAVEGPRREGTGSLHLHKPHIGNPYLRT